MGDWENHEVCGVQGHWMGERRRLEESVWGVWWGQHAPLARRQTAQHSSRAPLIEEKVVQEESPCSR